MFDIKTFQIRLVEQRKQFRPRPDVWAEFPSNNEFKFKRELLAMLMEQFTNHNSDGLGAVLAMINHDGADKDYTKILLALLDEKWHIWIEDIVSILEIVRDPESVQKLYEVAVNVPDYDDMRALAKKCMWALSAIRTPGAIEKLQALEKSEDKIISENATFQLREVIKMDKS